MKFLGSFALFIQPPCKVVVKMGKFAIFGICLATIISVSQAQFRWEGSVEGHCTDACDLYGEKYFWCHKPTHPFHRTGWDYCSPRPGLAANGCRCTDECDFQGSSYRWCKTEDNCEDATFQCGPVYPDQPPPPAIVYVPVFEPPASAEDMIPF